MALLAASVALGYFTIAIVVAPRIRMPTASPRLMLTIRGAAIAFFLGCGMTHVHILVHTLGVGTPQPVEAHEFVFHGFQAIGAWLFIAGAILRLELHIVPSPTRLQLQATVDEQRRLVDEAQSLAGQDELTGLARRWRFEEELAQQAALSRRHDVSSALVLIDVDGLKHVNDTFGHPAGDRVLMHVADAIRAQLRATDIAARIGGDEFALLLPATDSGQAQAVAQRLIASLQTTPLDERLPTSVSAGIAEIRQGTMPPDVIALADGALYAAKRAGGNCCVVSRPVPEAP